LEVRRFGDAAATSPALSWCDTTTPAARAGHIRHPAGASRSACSAYASPTRRKNRKRMWRVSLSRGDSSNPHASIIGYRKISTAISVSPSPARAVDLSVGSQNCTHPKIDSNLKLHDARRRLWPSLETQTSQTVVVASTDKAMGGANAARPPFVVRESQITAPLEIPRGKWRSRRESNPRPSV
jgi:hypothetical protein